MNGAGEESVDQRPQPADIDVAVVEVLNSCREAVMSPTKRLSRITLAATKHIPAVDHAGITVVKHRGVIRSVAATGSHPIVIDNIEQRYLQGPCFELPRDHLICRMDDVDRENRWPAFTEKLVSSTPVRSMLSVQLCSHSEGGAALNLYADQATAFDEEAQEMSLMFAAQAALAMEVDRREQALCSALINRDVIAQATGMLMGRFGIDASAAFIALVQLSEDNRESLPQIARRLLARNASV